MGWVRIDDRFFSHRKVLELSPLSRLLFLAALAHCNAELTDGFISTAAARAIAGQQCIPLAKATRELVEVELWHKRAEGWDVHDYHDYQPSAETERDRRDRISAARAEAGRRGGVKSGASRRSKPETKHGSKSEANHQPNTQAQGSPDPVPIVLPSLSDLRASPATAAETEDANPKTPDQIDVLTCRMVGFLARPSPQAVIECRLVATWTLAHVDFRFADEFVGYIGTLNGKPRSAAYFAKAIRDLAAQRGVEMPAWSGS